MHGAMGRAAAEEDEEANEEIGRADDVLIENGAAGGAGFDDEGEFGFESNGDTLAGDDAFNEVVELFPGTGADEDLGDVDGIFDRESADAAEDIAFANTKLFARTAGGDVEGDNRFGMKRGGAINPGDAVFRQFVFILLLEIYGSGNYRGYRHDDDERADELSFQFVHSRVSRDGETLRRDQGKQFQGHP